MLTQAFPWHNILVIYQKLILFQKLYKYNFYGFRGRSGSLVWPPGGASYPRGQRSPPHRRDDLVPRPPELRPAHRLQQAQAGAPGAVTYLCLPTLQMFSATEKSARQVTWAVNRSDRVKRAITKLRFVCLHDHFAGQSLIVSFRFIDATALRLSFSVADALVWP